MLKLYRAWRRQGEAVLWQAHTTTLRDDHSHGCVNRWYSGRIVEDMIRLVHVPALPTRRRV